MRVFQRLMLSVAVIVAVTFVNPIYAASEAACSIWLCLPMGFPSGCGDAKSALKKRIKKFQSPLPLLSSCLVSVGGQPVQSSEMSSKDGYAALIPTRQVCKEWERERLGRDWNSYCVKYESIPGHAIKDRSCHIDHEGHSSTPDGCSRTIRYVDTYMDGNAYGETYYFDTEGNKVSIPQL
ncbi:conjugal transfer protein TraL [Candidatus Enterovibrio escicola]|uniref:conjugal transfer protein TraL n=1 Tax=Candidatus Enterovibrio escicola TaxID=1927127 RepID=UPI001CC227B8|nr:conjugal transfer protein TraL [Candidatus Enterovibrio escacola]